MDRAKLDGQFEPSGLLLFMINGTDRPHLQKVNDVISGNATDNNLSDRYLTQAQPDYSQQFADYFVKYARIARETCESRICCQCRGRNEAAQCGPAGN